ncbi:MAG TPA: WD40 repeat domain-containing protein [Chloroflexia bacterium]|nr:WD40 repeat domain-containing protein [Chloroflexia bacterium]
MNQQSQVDTVAGLGRQTLAELLRHAQNTARLPESSQRTNLLSVLFLKARRKARTGTLRLPSGLTVAEAAEVAGAIATALRHMQRKDKTITPELNENNIFLKTEAGGIQAELHDGESAISGGEQPALARIYYRLVSGDSLPYGAATGQSLDTLANQYAETASVLRHALKNEYASATELAGAFGWSIYQREQESLVPPVKKSLLPFDRQKKERQKQAVTLSEPDQQSATPSNASVTAVISLGIALTLLAIFVIISTVTSQSNAAIEAKEPTPAPTFVIEPTPTPASALQISRSSDGSEVTRYNPAYSTPEEARFTAPDKLQPGSVTALSGIPAIQANTVQWSLSGENVYLGLDDGGWEVWDLQSKSRISRRELPNSDQYAQVSWSPDGENFAAIGLDGQLRLGSDGKVLRTIPFTAERADLSWQMFNGSSKIPFLWAPNSNYLLLRTQTGTIQLWNFQGGLRQVKDSGQIENVVVTSNNNFPSGWAWSADSRALASIKSDGKIRVFDAQTLLERYVLDISETANADKNSSSAYLDVYNTQAPAIRWSPDGRYLAVLKWKPLTPTDTKGNYIYDGSGSAEVTIYELPLTEPGVRGGTTGQSQNLKPAQTISIANLSGSEFLLDSRQLIDWSVNGRLLVGGYATPAAQTGTAALLSSQKGRVVVLDRSEDETQWKISTSFDLPGNYNTRLVRWSPEGRRILVNSNNGLLAVYTVPVGLTGEPQAEILAPPNEQAGSNWQPSPDGKWLAYTTNQRDIHLKAIADGQDKVLGPEFKVLPGFYTYSVAYLKWSPDGHFLAAQYMLIPQSSTEQALSKFEYPVRVWRLDQGEPQELGILLLPGMSNYVSPEFAWLEQDGKPGLNFELEGGLVGRWSSDTKLPPLEEQQKNLAGFAAKPQKPDGLPFKITGKILNMNGTDGYARDWFPDWKALLGGYRGQYAITKVLPPDVEYITSSDNVIKLEPAPETGTGNSRATVDISPNGRQIAIGLNNGLVKIYDGPSGKLIQAFSAHQGIITSLRFAPDGKSLATASSDHTVKVWDTERWRNTSTLRGLTAPGNLITWFNDSKSLLVSNASYNDSTLIWKAR